MTEHNIVLVICSPFQGLNLRQLEYEIQFLALKNKHVPSTGYYHSTSGRGGNQNLPHLSPDNTIVLYVAMLRAWDADTGHCPSTKNLIWTYSPTLFVLQWFLGCAMCWNIQQIMSYP